MFIFGTFHCCLRLRYLVAVYLPARAINQLIKLFVNKNGLKVKTKN